MRRTYLLLLCLILPCLMLAQQPGFMGKRFLYAAQATGTFGRDGFLTYDLQERKSPFPILLGLRTEYISSRNSTIALELFPTRGGKVSRDSSEVYRDQSLGIGLHRKLYAFKASGNLAPMGFFFDFGLNFYITQKSVENRANSTLVKETPLYIRPVFGLGKSYVVGRIFYEIYGLLQFGNSFSGTLYGPDALNGGLRLSIGFL